MFFSILLFIFFFCLDAVKSKVLRRHLCHVEQSRREKSSPWGAWRRAYSESIPTNNDSHKNITSEVRDRLRDLQGWPCFAVAQPKSRPSCRKSVYLFVVFLAIELITWNLESQINEVSGDWRCLKQNYLLQLDAKRTTVQQMRYHPQV